MTNWRLFPSTNGPSTSSGDNGLYTMGLSFEVTSPGLFFAGYWWWVADTAQNTAPQEFALWLVVSGATQSLVAGSTVTSGTLSLGWNYIPLTTTLTLTDAQEYRAVTAVAPGSFTTGYSVTSHVWDTGIGASGITSGPLFAYPQPTEPQSSVQMSFDTGGTDPTVNYPSSVFNASNYWLDVQVTDVAIPGSSTYRLWPFTSGAAASSVDATSYVLGMSFEVTQAGCSLTGYWWWIADANQNATASPFALWQSTGVGTGTLVASSQVTSGALSLGWNFVSLATSVPLTVSTEYRAVVGVQKGAAVNGGYSATTHYWDTGSGFAGIVNGPLMAYSAHGNATNPEPIGDSQDVLTSGTVAVSTTYPHSSFSASNYWLDVQISQVVPPAALPILIKQEAVNRASLW